MPECMDPLYEGDPCFLDGLELWPENALAWEAYACTGHITMPGFLGLAPLDEPGVITHLKETGRWPETEDERDELLSALATIHQARAEAVKGPEDDGEKT